MKGSFQNILKSSKRKPNLIETDRVKNFCTSIFQNLLINKIIKHYSQNKYLGAVFAEHFNRTIKDLPKRPVFEKSDGNWIGLLSVITKQYNNRVHTSTKLTPIEASFK